MQSTDKPRLLIVGNGMIGVKFLEELVARRGHDVFDITVIGDEYALGYNRIKLSQLLSGECEEQDIMLQSADWYLRHGIRLRLGQRVAAIDRLRRCVTLTGGATLHYDKLVLATGSNAFVPPIKGHQLAGVIAYRTLRDTRRMLGLAREGGEAVVIGGGLLGLEAANGLSMQGMQVTVLHNLGWIMNQQLDPQSGLFLHQHLQQRGVRIVCNANTAAITGDGQVDGVLLADGETLPARLVVIAAGIRPNGELGEAATLHTRNGGILVNDVLQTNDKHIHAIGECVNHRGRIYGLVQPLNQMAEVLARRLTGDLDARFTGASVHTRLKVTGVDVFSAGDLQRQDGDEEVVLCDPVNKVYKKALVRDGRLVGSILYGAMHCASWHVDLIQGGHEVQPHRRHLLFGRP